MIKGKIGDFFRIISMDKQNRIQIRKCSDGTTIDEVVHNFKANPEWDCEGGFDKIAPKMYKCVALVCIEPVLVIKIIYGSLHKKLISFLQNIDGLEIGELCIFSDIQNLRLVADYIVAFIQRHEISRALQAKIELAVTEAVDNAILHGNEQDVNKKVMVSLSLNEGIVTAVIKDEGKGFDFADSYNDPTQPDTITKECGRGLYLMKCLSDEMILEDNGSKVVMKFNLNIKQNYDTGRNNS